MKNRLMPKPRGDTMDDIYWTTRDGTKIPVTKMSTGHLKNTINMLQRKALEKLHEGFSYLSLVRGEAASDAVEFEIQREQDVYTYWIDILSEELSRREYTEGPRHTRA